MAARSIALSWQIPAFPVNAEIWQGEDINLTLTRATATAITSWTITGYVRKNHDDADPELTLTGSITDATNGVFTLSLTSAQTAALALQGYTMEVWRTDSGSVTLLALVFITVLEGTRT